MSFYLFICFFLFFFSLGGIKSDGYLSFFSVIFVERVHGLKIYISRAFSLTIYYFSFLLGIPRFVSVSCVHHDV